MCCTAPPSRRPKQEVAVAAHTPAAPLAEAMPPAKKKAKTHKEDALAVQTAAWACKFRNLLNYKKSDACKKASHVCMHIYIHIYIIHTHTNKHPIHVYTHLSMYTYIYLYISLLISLLPIGLLLIPNMCCSACC